MKPIYVKLVYVALIAACTLSIAAEVLWEATTYYASIPQRDDK